MLNKAFTKNISALFVVKQNVRYFIGFKVVNSEHKGWSPSPLLPLLLLLHANSHSGSAGSQRVMGSAGADVHVMWKKSFHTGGRREQGREERS